MIAVDGYQIIERIEPESNCFLYTATDIERARPTLILCRSTEGLSEADIQSLAEDYERIKRIKSEHVLHIYDFRTVTAGNRQDIVFICENNNLKPFRGYRQAAWTDLNPFFDIAIGLAKAANRLHQNGILLKEINPTTLLMRSDTGQVLVNTPLILLARPNPIAQRDVKGLYDKAFLAHVLPYVSPEQTGRMNRQVDYRSDFYSFGVLLYQLLTGRTPFASGDPLELIHAHIARQPPEPARIRRDIPEMLSRLTLKLLAKMPEDRYQSAFGLLSDLERCRQQYTLAGTISSFALGNRDAPERLNLSTRLFGREAPLARLLAIYEKVKAGSFETLDIRGAAGIGKSSLVEELRYPVNEDGGFFGSGKYDPLTQNIPYSAIIEAFKDIIQKILRGNAESIALWKSKIEHALGPYAPLIAGFLPELEFVIGAQPSSTQEPPDVQEKLFGRICESFIRVFAQKEHPLVIFLDNMQWVDSASLDLIEETLNGAPIPYCFFIGAYRDNEMAPDHPMVVSDQSIRAKGVPIGVMSLGPIGKDNVRQMILDTFSKNVADVEALTHLVYEKTHGNPFFVGQFIQSLYLRKLLYFDFQTGLWRWHESGIKAQAYTDNVIELMSSEIRKLPDESRAVLKIAACIGSRFDFETLADANDAPVSRTAAGLLKAVEAGFVVPKGDGGQFLNQVIIGKQAPAGPAAREKARGLPDDNSFEFLHDRVHQAVYDLVPDHARKALHFKIGNMLLKQVDHKGLQEKIFNIVNHLSHGVTTLATAAERTGHAHLYLWAGCKAKEGTAYQQAITYFNIGIALLPNDCWDAHYELAFVLYREKMECEFLNRNHNEAEHLFQFVISRTRSDLDKATLLCFKMVMHAGLGRHQEAVGIGLEGLGVLGVHIKQGRRHNQYVDLMRFRRKLSRQKIEALAQRPEVTDPRQRLIFKILLDMTISVYICNPYRLLAIASKIIELTFKFGNSPAACVGYAIYGAAVCAGFGNYRKGHDLGALALEVNDRFGQSGVGAKVMFYYAVAISHWRRHLQVSTKCCLQGLHQALENGDLNFAGYHIQYLLVFLFASGAPLEAVDAECAKHTDFIVNSKDGNAYNYIISLRQTIKCLQGQTRNHTILDDENFREAVHIQRMINQDIQIVLLRHYVLKLQLLYIMGDIDGALQAGQLCARRIDYHLGTIVVPEFYFYQSLACLAHYSSLSLRKRLSLKSRLRLSLITLGKMARNCPANFEHKLLLIKGEIARANGHFEKALVSFQRAIDSARTHGYLHMEAMGCELAAKLLLDRGLHTLARAFMQEANGCYLKWGAPAKSDLLRRTYPQLLAEKLPGSPQAGSLPIDYATVTSALQAVSTEIVLDRLLEKLMKIVIENAGAQRVLFVLPQGDGFEVKARSSIGGPIRITSQTMPAPTEDELLLPVLHYVNHTHDPLVVDDVQLHPDFRTDPYVIHNKPKSLFCLPVLRQSDLVAILYFENNITTGAFTPDRVETVQLIASQAAISIENARLYEEVTKKERDLKALSENLRMLSSELLLTEERERRRIAVELHDRIGHALANVKMQISILQESTGEDERGQILQKIAEHIDQSIQDTQSLTFELSPPVLYDLGLEAAIEWLVDQMQEQYRLSVTFSDDHKPKPLDESVRVLAFQATRELLFNVVKHAHAHQAWISLQRRDDAILIEIADDGIGLEKSIQRKGGRKKGGFGLFSIQERLKHFGGRLEIGASAEKGTRITLIAPMHLTNREQS
jgi:predicted ATPase/signal transduction histidine kinase